MTDPAINPAISQQVGPEVSPEVSPVNRWAVAAGLALMIVALILGIPMQSGPDEPAHLVRAAGLARGDIVGVDLSNGSGVDDAARAFNAPDWADDPNPGCYAFQPEVTADCVSGLNFDGPTSSTAASYPPLAHVGAGLGTLLVNNSAGRWAARLTGAIPTVALLVFAFFRLARRSPMAIGATMLAISPAAMMTLGVVNPSALTVAGTVALVAGLATPSGDGGRWLAVSGFCAVVVSRSDGIVWALIVTALALFVVGRSWRQMLRSLTHVQTAIVATVSALTVIWTLTFRPELVRVPTDARGIGLVIVAINRIGQHLDEAVGLFSWFDTASPRVVFDLWWLGVGLVAGAALMMRHRRSLLAASIAFGLFIFVGLAADIVFGSSVGLVWQGRYEFPLLIGGVMLLGLSASFTDRSETVGRATAVLAIVLWNATLWQALRRWGAGATGTIYPWRWQLGEVAIPPLLTMAAFAVGSVVLAVALVGRAASVRPNGRKDLPSTTVSPAP